VGFIGTPKRLVWCGVDVGVCMVCRYVSWTARVVCAARLVVLICKQIRYGLFKDKDKAERVEDSKWF